LITLSNNDGAIVSLTRQAKELGITKFTPYFQIKDLCDKHGVIVCSSNYELIADISGKVMNIIGRFAPEHYCYSIDEMFLSFKNASAAIPCLTTQGRLIRRAVWREARIAVCVGIGETLTLAKVANHAAKKIRGYEGVCLISTDEERIAILKQLNVGDVWGIGRRLSQKLELLNIRNAYELASMSPSLARKQFNIEVERTVRELNGQACKKWDEVKADKKQIFSTRSLGQRITNYDLLLQALSKHVAIVAKKARKQGSTCKIMVLFASSSPHDARPQSFKEIVHFACPTNCSVQLTKAMSKVAHRLYREDVQYYRVGVGLLELGNEKFDQFDLFNPRTDNPALMGALDSINSKYGTDTLFLAAQGIEQKWAMRRDFLSPQYTTKWSDIPIIKCK